MSHHGELVPPPTFVTTSSVDMDTLGQLSPVQIYKTAETGRTVSFPRETTFNVIRAENGFILRSGEGVHRGDAYNRYHICITAEDLAKQIVAILVEEKMK